MKTIDEYLDEQINEQLCQAVLSGSKGEGPSKAKIRPVEIKGQVIYQVSETVGTKVLHRNYHREELIQYLKEGLQHHFSQLQSSGMTLDGTVLVSKKGKVTIKTRRHPGNAQNQSTSGKDKPAQTGEKKQILAHNRVKQYILKENTPVPFLVDLGVMKRDGSSRRNMINSGRSTAFWNLSRTFFQSWISRRKLRYWILAAESPTLLLPCIII